MSDEAKGFIANIKEVIAEHVKKNGLETWSMPEAYDRALLDVARLQAENAELRGALERIVSACEDQSPASTMSGIEDVARQALGHPQGTRGTR